MLTITWVLIVNLCLRMKLKGMCIDNVKSFISKYYEKKKKIINSSKNKNKK